MIFDFPTAWAIQRKGGLTHHERCSCVPGWDPISGPGFLCDCGSVIAEFKRLKEDNLPIPNPPEGYTPLPKGVRCRCLKLWREADGSYWCCNPKKS